MDKLLHFEQGFRYALEGNHPQRSGMFFLGPWMYCFLQQMDAKHILETGMGEGAAGWWLAHAAKEHGGMYIGVELLKSRCEGLSKKYTDLGITNHCLCMDSIHLTTEDIAQFTNRIDFALLDGNHDKEHILHELHTIEPLVPKRIGYVFVHDIYTASRDGWAAVRELSGWDIFEVARASGMGMLRKQ